MSNTADFGTIYCRESQPIITNCIISGNTQDYYGGGVFCQDGQLAIANCTISDNTAGYAGGGIACTNSQVTITNCTIADNSAPSGPALACDSLGEPTPSNLEIANSILWDDGNPVWNNDGSTITITYSDVQGGWTGAGNIDDDPLFDDTYHLTPDSPCIEAGDPNFVPEPDECDIDGQMRVWDGDENGAWIVDMGSDEFGSQAPGDLNGDGCVNQSDLGILLADWGCIGGDCPGDCDFDGDTDQADLGILLAHWGKGCP